MSSRWCGSEQQPQPSQRIRRKRKKKNVNYMILLCAVRSAHRRIQGADNLIIIFILIYTHNCLKHRAYEFHWPFTQPHVFLHHLVCVPVCVRITSCSHLWDAFHLILPMQLAVDSVDAIEIRKEMTAMYRRVQREWMECERNFVNGLNFVYK